MPAGTYARRILEQLLEKYEKTSRGYYGGAIGTYCKQSD